MNTADKANPHRLAENVVQSTAAKLFWELERRLEEIPTLFPGVTVERHGEEVVLSGAKELLDQAAQYVVDGSS